MGHVIFYEIFKEEEEMLKQSLPANVKAAFTSQTIQESQDKTPPAKLISVRTQSQIPLEWADQIEGILTRSQGYDHLLEYLKHCGKKNSLWLFRRVLLGCGRRTRHHGNVDVDEKGKKANQEF